MGNLWNTWWRSRSRRSAQTARSRPSVHHLMVEHLEDRSVPAITLTNTTLDFGSDPVGVVNPSPRATTVLNTDPNNVLVSVTSSGANAADFTILSGPTIGQPLSTSPQSFRFAFTPSTQGAESASYSIDTTDGTLIVSLTGTGTSPVSLTSPNLDFGSVTVGTPSPSVRSTSILNQDPNNVLLGITASGPNAAAFQLVAAPTVGQPLPVGVPQAFRFSFTPTTAGTESATYTLNTTDGILTVTLTGTGTSPESLTASNLDFGSVVTGTPSPSVRSTSILNQDPNNVLLGITASGANAADFQLVAAPTVGQPLPAGTPQAFRFGFTPTSVGTESATYTLNTTDGALVITLTGTGTAPATLTSPNLNFGSVTVGSASPSVRSTSILNQNPNNVLLSITASGPNAADFQLVAAPTVGQPLPTLPSNSTLRFSFTPTTLGTESATFTLNTTDGPLVISLTGTGVSSAQPTLSLNHSSVSFGNVPQGIGAQPLGVGLWNFAQNVQLLGVSSTSPLAADFPLVTGFTPGQLIPVATSQTSPSLNLQFGFIPSTLGNESVTYTIQTSAGNINVTLSGTGISPVSLNHSSVAFGNVPQGVGATPEGVGIWNYGQNVQILGVTSNSPQAGDFPLLTPVTSGQVLPIASSPTSSSLSLQFGFIPSTIGNESATYTIATTAGNFTVTLTGTGISPVSLNHSSVAFGSVPQGVGATPEGVGIWNYGQNVQILGVTSNSSHAADFPLLTPVSSGQVLPIASSPTSSSLSLQFGFIPSTIGNESATYTIATTAGNFTVTLTGNGTSPISLSRSSLDFGSAPVGVGVPPLSVGLWNFGQNVQLLGISSTSPLAGDFPLLTPVASGQTLAVAQPVTATSAGSASLSLQFGFIPSTTGAESVTYIIQTTAGNLTLTLTGTGASPISLSPTSLDMGSVPVGTPSQVQTTTLQNLDPNNVLQSVTFSGANAHDFVLLPGPFTVGQPLGVGAIPFSFGFIPSTSGSESATVTIQTTDGTVTLNLTGAGTSPISLSPTSLDMGSVPVGTPSQVQTTTLQNLDPNNVLQSVTFSGANPNDFVLLPGPFTVGQPLGTGSIQFAFGFIPSTIGSEAATVTIQTTDGAVTLNLTGTGTSSLSLLPTSLDFGSVPMGTPAPAQTATLQNLDPNNVLQSVTFSGANPNDFVLLPGPFTVGQPLGAGSIPFTFGFIPSTSSAESATVTIQTTDGVVTLNLTGTGTSPISLSPTSYDFGSVPEGTPAPTPVTVTLQNQDPNNSLLSITVSGANPNDFQLVAGPPLGPIGYGSEQFLFTFTPSTSGAESATVTFHTTDGDLTLTLTGTGISPLSLTPSSLDFGSVALGTSALTPQIVTLQNLDPNNSLLGIVTGGANPNDFQLVAGPPLGPIGYGSEQFLFTFTPSTIGAESATVTFETTDGNLTLNLTGIGASPISLSASNLAFGSVPLGVTTPTQTVVLQNQDPNNSLLSITMGGTNPNDFQLVAGPPLGPIGYGSEQFLFTFTPSVVGSESATVTFHTSDGDLTLSLTGTGVTPILLDAPSLAFGSDPVGVTNPSPRSTALLNNDPNNVLLSVTPGGNNPGDFTLLSGPPVGSVLGVGSQTFRFAFTPSTSGAESATYTITTTDGSAVVTLTGQGTSPISLSAPSLAFGSVPVGVTNPSPRSTTLLNQDPNNVLLSVTPGGNNPGDFTLLSGPPVGSVLGVGSQTFRFAFTPSTSGAESATYTITTTDGTEVVHLSGSGSTPMSLVSPNLAFGSVPVGVTNSSPRSAALINDDPNNVLLSVTPGGANPGDFTLLSGPAVGSTLAVGAQTFRFAFTPSTSGAESATYTIITTDGTEVIHLSGSGGSPISLSSTSLAFGSDPVGVTNPSPRSTALINDDPNNVLLSVTPGGNNPGDFTLLSGPAVGSTLAVGAQTFRFAFTPSTSGAESATYTITTTDGTEVVHLSGSGTSPISLASTNLAFGSVKEGTTNPSPRSTALLNQDPNNVLLSVTAGGANPSDFTLLSGPAVGSTLGVGPQTFRFAFTPTTLGNESATYTIVTTDGTVVVNLSGKGTANTQPPTVSLSHSSLAFGKVAEGTASQPLSVGVWNFGQNVQLLGVTSSSPQAGDFQLLTPITPGQLLPVAQSVAGDPQASSSLNLQFAFTPSTVGGESATYTIATSAGNFTVTLTGTGTSPVSLSHSTISFGSVQQGTASQPLSVGVWNFGQNVQLLGVTSTSPQAGDFQLLTPITPGQLLPVAQSVAGDPQGSSSLNLQFAFTPSTVGGESATYTIATSAGNFTVTLTGAGTSPVSLSHSSLAFGKVTEGTASQPLSVGVWNFGQNVQLLGVTSTSPQAADFQLLTPITPGQLLPVAQSVAGDPQGSSSLNLQFAFTPTTVGAESATYTISTTAGNFTVTLTGTGTSPVSLSHSSLAFGKVIEGTVSQPLSVGVWNFGQNVQLLGVSSTSPQAGDFQLLTPITAGELLAVAQSVAGDPQGSSSLNLQFIFTPSTVGAESATFTISTTAGDFTITLTGTGTPPVSLSHSSMNFGTVAVGSPSTVLSVGVWNFGQNVQLLGVSSTSPQAADFQLLTPITPGQLLPVAQSIGSDPQGSSSLNLQFVFTPSTTGSETATYIIHTSAGDLTLTLTGTGS